MVGHSRACDVYTSAYSEFIDAYAQVVIDHVKARPSVKTRLFQHTLIQIDLTLSTYKPRGTCTVEGVEEVLKWKSWQTGMQLIFTDDASFV